MRSFGLDFERLRRELPRLVYCSITGYGQDGPYAHQPGYDPHTLARGLIQQVTLIDGSSVDLLGPAPKLSATPATVRLAPPVLGQDTDAVLGEILGLDAGALADYRIRGVI